MGKMFAACAALLSAPHRLPPRVPWCVKLDAFTKNCAFADDNECVAVARNATSPATGVGHCVRNRNYQPPPRRSACQAGARQNREPAALR